MKKLLFLLLSATTLTAYSQNTRLGVSYSDPSVTNMQLYDNNNAATNADRLEIGTPVKMQFTVGNGDAANAVPAGTCLVKFTLGSKFRLVTDLSVPANLPLSNYFHWNVAETPRGEQFILTGELYRDLPAHFSGTAVFTVMPYKVGSSTATCQVLISNHNNTDVVLSDVSPFNNAVSKTYTNTLPLGIKFTRFDAVARGCAVEINWAIFDVDKATRSYTIEISDDGFTFRPVQTIISNGSNEGMYLLDAQGKKSITIRVKAETPNGQFVYSDRATPTNICSGAFDIAMYPNPVPAEVKEITIQARSGIFNGKYNIRMTDVSGKEIKKMDATYYNQLTVKISTGFIVPGSYFITVTGEDGIVNSLKFVKQ